MGGDRRSPPHRRVRGDGGVKLRSSSDNRSSADNRGSNGRFISVGGSRIKNPGDVSVKFSSAEEGNDSSTKGLFGNGKSKEITDSVGGGEILNSNGIRANLEVSNLWNVAECNTNTVDIFNSMVSEDNDNGNCSGGGSKGGENGFSDSGSLKTSSRSCIDSVIKKTDRYESDAKNLLNGMMKRDQCTQKIEEFNENSTPDGTAMERDVFLGEENSEKNFKILPGGTKGFMNLDQSLHKVTVSEFNGSPKLDNRSLATDSFSEEDNRPSNFNKSAEDLHVANHQLKDNSDVLISISKNGFSIPDAIQPKTDLRVIAMEGSSTCLHADGNFESSLQLEEGQISGLTFNIHNPMFGMDVDMDNVKNSETCLKDQEELFVTNKCNFGKIGITNDAKFLDRMECSEGICLNANINDTTGNSGLMQAARTEFGRKPSVFSSSQNNAHNAWKKPIHVPVYWQNKGKASDDGKFVKLNLDAISSNQLKLEKALVGKVIGKKLPFNILAAELRKRWEPYGEFRFMLTGEDSFICIFNSLEARDSVLMGGPWLIGGHIVGLDKWSSSYSQDSLSGLTSPVWIRLPKLPLLYWDDDNLARIASMVGQPLWIDAYTSGQTRCAYARVCVRLDLAQKLPKGVWIPGINGNFFQHVEYEGIHSVCFNCGSIGHKTVNCGGEIARRGTDGGIRSNTSKAKSALEGIGGVQNSFYSSRKGKESVSVFSNEPNPIGFTNRGECSKTSVGVKNKFPTDGLPCGIAVKGDCSDTGMAFTDKENGANLVSCNEEDSDNGPWFFVARRKNKLNTRGKNSGQNSSGSFGRIGRAYREDFSRVKDQDGSHFSDKPTAEQAMVFFSSTPKETNGLQDRMKSGVPLVGNMKHKGTKGPSEREIGQLGPITSGPRKRKKGDSLGEIDLVCCQAVEGDTVALEDCSKVPGLICGGDASPLDN